MSANKTFHLPDLGEGLPDATIVEWFVKVGDTVRLDDNLVAMETAKAVVEVPSPVSGKVTRLAGAAGDVIITGAMLAQFEVDPSMPQRAEGQDTGHGHGGHAPPAHGVGSEAPGNGDQVVASDDGGTINAAGAPAPKGEPGTHTEVLREDSGTVVGAMQSSDAVRSEQAVAVGGVKAMPAVRALARKHGVDLTRVRATGSEGVVTMDDVKRAAADGSAKAGGAAPARAVDRASVPASTAAAGDPARSMLSQSGRPMRTQPPGVAATGQPEQLKGVRRNMARVMADAHASVVPTTLHRRSTSASRSTPTTACSCRRCAMPTCSTPTVCAPRSSACVRRSRTAALPPPSCPVTPSACPTSACSPAATPRPWWCRRRSR